MCYCSTFRTENVVFSLALPVSFLNIYRVFITLKQYTLTGLAVTDN